MKLNSSKIEFSRNDIKREIKIPSNLTKNLAYFIGFHVGDGCLQNSYRKKDCKTTDYNASYSGHETDELELHKKVLIPLIKDLFNINPFCRIGHKTTIEHYFRSKAIHTFLNKIIGLPVGNKKNIDIPKIIKNSNIEIRKEFLKGLADTEFCLTFKKRYRDKHYYPCIKFGTESKKLKNSVNKMLKSLGFKTTTLSDYKTYRKGNLLTTNTIDLNGKYNLKLWMRKMGFNSTKHLTKYYVWKNFGFCPPNTNIIERRKFLKGELDINSYYEPVA
tara:strand:+ start:1134 stop:1955 length:822 start_codon:yes stop_codon:yes gene_type:complete